MRPRRLEQNTQKVRVSTGHHTTSQGGLHTMKTQSAGTSTEVTEVLDLMVVLKEAIVKMLQQAIMKDISSTNLK